MSIIIYKLFLIFIISCLQALLLRMIIGGFILNKFIDWYLEELQRTKIQEEKRFLTKLFSDFNLLEWILTFRLWTLKDTINFLIKKNERLLK